VAQVIFPPVTDEPPVPLEGTLDGTLGFETIEMSEDAVRGRVAVEPRIQQPMGLVHGGVYAALAESLASAATFSVVYPEGSIAVGLSNSTSFIRPITKGHVNAAGRRRHKGRTTWIWDIDFSDDEGRLCASTRVTMAVRPIPASGS
jgi:1,4-dihydroxy-2-naphthoyl-CoA hydrolase